MEQHPMPVTPPSEADLNFLAERFDNTAFHPSQDISEWEPSQARPLTGEPKRFENGMSWEMDETGFHRIVSAEGVGGDWAMYTSIAASPDGRFIAVSAYFAGLLPAETLLSIDKVPELGK